MERMELARSGVMLPVLGMGTARYAGGRTPSGSDPEVVGYIVLKTSDQRGYIADLLALPGRLDVIRSLLEQSLQIFRQANVMAAICWLIRHGLTASIPMAMD